MRKHTSGPWHRNIPPATRYPVIFSGRNKHVLSATPSRGIPEDEAEANHDLITAAPDLLAALRLLLEQPQLQGERAFTARGPIEKARAAIAKAEGSANG